MISVELKNVILKELGLQEFPIEGTTLAAEVPGWDSLSHVRIINAVETAFGVRFKALEVMRLRNVGELQALLDRKRSSV